MILFDIGAKKISLFLKNVVTDDVFQKFAEVLDKNITNEDIISLEDSYIPSNFVQEFIWQNIQDNDIAKTLFEIATFEYYYTYSNEILKLLNINQTRGITLKNILLMTNNTSYLDNNDVLQAYYIIKKILHIKSYSANMEEIGFSLDFTLAYLISDGSYMPSIELQNYINISFNYESKAILSLWQDDFQNFCENVFSSENSIGIVSGENFSGKKSLVEKAIHSKGYNSIMIDYGYFKSNSDDILKLKVLNLIRDCFLMQGIICITDVSYDGNTSFEQKNILNVIKFLMLEYDFMELPLFITTDLNVSIVPHLEYLCYTFSIPKLTSIQSESAWNYFQNKYDFSQENCFNDISKRIILPLGKIEKVVYSSIINSTYNDKYKTSQLCYNLIEDKNFKGVNKIHSEYTWEDLKLYSKEKDILKQICSYVQFKDFVMNSWNMKKSYQYGSCASALFTGPPGTGKTMAAHIIANTLNLALYRVDLSQIMDKYIGETEKHLNEIFDYAENSNAVLFFDEADALIGKRSDISDAKDKFANTQVSYILQKIEEFNGIVLMATNYSNNIDNAIIRRIRYIVKFQFPNSDIREQIWKSILNDDIPHTNIDFKYLSSDEFEFSGAVIKNIILNATILAVSEGSPVDMSHIARSIVSEYNKNNRTIIPETLRQFLK